MQARAALRGFVLLGVLAMPGCSTPPPGTPGAIVDQDYGIPPSSVPKSEMRSNGLLENGLLPLPPNTGS